MDMNPSATFDVALLSGFFITQLVFRSSICNASHYRTNK